MSDILITGGSSGIGRELVRQLIQNGHHVWAIARNEHKLQQLGTELCNKNLFYSLCDVRELQSWMRLKAQMEVQKFFPDIIILNAGITGNTQVENNLTNYQGVVNGLATFKNNLQKKGGIVAVSGSLFAFVEAPFNHYYSQSKKDAWQFLLQQSQEMDNQKIAFHYFVLGPVDTNNSNNSIPFWKRLFIPNALQAANHIVNHLGDNQFIHVFPISSKILLTINRFLPKSFMNTVVTFLKR